MDVAGSSRPRTVVVSVVTLSVLLVTGQIEAIINPAPRKYEAALAKALPILHYVHLASIVATTLLFAFFIYSIYKGKNWARILYLVICIFIVLVSIPALLGVLHVSREDQIVGAVRIIAMLVAVVLLFTAPGNQWFRRRFA